MAGQAIVSKAMNSALVAPQQERLGTIASTIMRVRHSVERLVRLLPIRWRILSIAGLNTGVVIVLAALIWNGANVLSSAWDELRQVRQSDQLLGLLASEAGRLQNLIHRYMNQPSPEIFAEILLLREAVLGTLRRRGSSDPMLSGSVDELALVTERFFNGFGDLRVEQSRISDTYETSVLKAARDMANLFADVERAVERADASIWPALGRSREAFAAALVAVNRYYLSPAAHAAEEARKNIAAIEQSIPDLMKHAENEVQRAKLNELSDRVVLFRKGLEQLTAHFATRDVLLRTAIDGNQSAMITAIDRLSEQMREREQQVQANFDHTLADIYRKVAFIAVIFLSMIVIMGFAIARSISAPLQDLRTTMQTIVSGQYDQKVEDTGAHDEIGEMARSVEVFRQNAIAKRQVEDDLRASKERAEQALSELRQAQTNLIEAEKLAALGGLVAGVAHEVNNPVGIGLTVASSFARRAESFAKEVGEGPLRKSSLDAFVSGSRDAAQQLVANLQRAGELIQSFKQVAVDRSHADRRQFDLREATDQIVASLRPALKRTKVSLSMDGATGVQMDSYPGSYGQVVTNLFLNALAHAFPDDRPGRVFIETRDIGGGLVEVLIGDDGIGMTEEVQKRAFDPFFTTQRTRGGTGLGLHIVYNLVTQRLGGRISLDSQVGRGTVFRMTLPRSAPREHSSGQPAGNKQAT
jgi:signal transduction histidine kinase